MMEKSFGFLLFLKRTNNNNDNRRHVYARITVDGISKEFSTKHVWYEDRWEQNSGRAIGNREDARTLNNYLDVVTNKVYQAKKILMEKEDDISAIAIRNMVLGVTDDRKMLLEIFAEHNKRMETLKGVDYAPGTIQRYVTSYDHTKAFIQYKYGIEDIEVRKLNYDFISEYEFWLKSVRKCAHNTTMKYLANFKKIVLQCVKKGWIQRDPFYGFKFSKKEVVRVVLTKEEIEKLAQKDFRVERLTIVRDIFLFSCYTGLAYIDVQKLRRANIVKGIDGDLWVTTSRQKTNTPTRLPLLPPAIEIMERYKDHERCLIDDFVLPVFTNQRMNAYLKEIAELCEINKELTFHIARHTFATTVTLSNGVPIETVSKMLGHKSLRQTQHYAKIVDLKISEDMKQLRSKILASE